MQAVLGPHIGDQESLAARERFLAHLDDWRKLYRFEPQQIVYDLHPEYFSTQWAQRQAVPTIGVQHHHAHVVASMLEHGWLDRRVLGVAWDGTALAFAPGAQRGDAPADDAREDLWRTYYAHIFNPARLNPRMMRQEMPQKYWKHLPETQLLPELIRTAGQRVREMQEREAQAPRRRIPKRDSSVE